MLLINFKELEMWNVHISTFAERLFYLECLSGKNNRLYYVQYNKNLKMKLDGLFLKLFERVL